ncbi:hypothetical protein EDD21DRAFT_331803 [Dissophora ornata]|nr:hypothetical protein EDD21DRAFT_331803 [Dissophora ornata]
MSASAVAGAAKAAASKTSSPSTVYLFRHIQTSQQITDETRRPAHVRPDHWHPLVAIQGFAHHNDALSFHNSLRDHQLNMNSAKVTDKKHMLQPRRLRAPQEMNQVDETLVKMVELLNEQPQIKATKGKNIRILWEREGVRKQLLEKEGVSLLEGVQHGDLSIKRGRDIVNA